MSEASRPRVEINSWLEDEIFQQYTHDRRAVDTDWKEFFDEVHGVVPTRAKTNGDHDSPGVTVGAAPPRAVNGPAAYAPGATDQLVPLRGTAARIADNMTASLAIPVASSQRVIPVKVIDENRRILNQQRSILGRPKISYTHIIGWAIVQALREFPGLNDAYTDSDGESFRVVRKEVNLGIAVDVAGKDGARSLLVPNIKNAGAMNFAEYVQAFDDIVNRARSGKLAIKDFQGTTISLTNPGTVGTVGSMPRLMQGQGAIIATGAIDYPAEFQGMTPEMRAILGLSKVMTISCTYDHRIIQGAESGLFLGRIETLLNGEQGFYDEIFADLKMPYHPVKWEPDKHSTRWAGSGSRLGDVAQEAAVLQLINAYRVRGHLIADLDPLGRDPQYHPELDPSTYGLSIWDLDREFITGALAQTAGEDGGSLKTLREILEQLRQTYCGKIGCEYMDIQDPVQKAWLQQRMEPQANQWPLGDTVKRRVLERLLDAEGFEQFLQARFVGQKRFSLEGAEAAIAILDEIIERAANGNVHEIVIGMAHRGRLNVLANVIGKPLTQIFSEFEGDPNPNATHGSGDVKYHLGASGVRRASTGREVIASVAPNPSHLEAVDPVVEGIVRPKQDRLGDRKRERVIPLLIHGDAAFAGQGVVAETLNLSQLEGYHTGGTIHVIINNQIGFTARPEELRSSSYSTDVARMVQAPIFHVNGDDPEACVRVAQLAFDYRQRFKRDVVIDMVCYRRHGHNEGDDPNYTQPILYRKIRQHPSVATLYADRLVREGLITREEVDSLRARVSQRLSEAHEASQKRAERFEVADLGAVSPEQAGQFCPHTAIDRKTVEFIVDRTTRFPDGFHVHPKLQGFLERRKQVLHGAPVDWATAELLAFGSLLLEGTPVRLSGQDVGRGTFSQRHLEYFDYETGEQYDPLKHLSPDQANFGVWDSLLSEYAVMGFEFGYSVGDPLSLVIWEAQFGDFCNGAQIMIDQFISTSEQKWGQPSGLVLLLPHGYEGQGPEHSSARINRFLQLCAQDNMQVCNCTTPAQYFHLLRRQMYGGPDRRGMRKPLIVFSPKSLLRHPRCVSDLSDITSGTFRTVLDDPWVTDPDKVTRVVFCSGKIFYELVEAREKRGAGHIAFIRTEQFYPLPAEEIRDALLRYPLTAEILWVQEEPVNMGPGRFMIDKMRPIVEDREIRYVGRPESASPATGSLKRHLREQSEIIEQAFAPAPAPAVIRKGRRSK